MKRITLRSLASLFLLLAVAPGFAPAVADTPNPNSAVVKTRVFNDCPTSVLSVTNNYPASISIEDQFNCFGFANRHIWSFSENGVDPADFDNDSDFRFSADLVLSGTGDGEAGLRISPWWSQEVDGAFNVRTPDGEIAVFGGRLPFFSFTAAFGLLYQKGDPIHLEVTYKANGLSAASPGTIEYGLTYNGLSYTSGPIAFDMGNPAEDPPHGLWGILNEARVGGYFQPRSFFGTSFKATFTNIDFVICSWERDLAATLPAATQAVISPRVFNDCPTSDFQVVNNFPAQVSLHDGNYQCFGFANLHTWTLGDANGPLVLNNNQMFRMSADVRLSATGAGHGEAGLRVSPWWSQQVDGRFNIRLPDGEIAVFGGRLPFFSFSAAFGLFYQAGEPMHMEIIYRTNGLTASSPATAEYQLVYQGRRYTSGQRPFDMGNPNEPFGLWGILDNARAGGYMQARIVPLDPASGLTADFTNIQFHAGVDMEVDVDPQALNLKAGGRWVTAFLEPPAPYSASDIDVHSLRLNGVAGPEQVGTATIGDHDGDGIADLAVKFSRQAVHEFAGDGVVIITGEVAGACFEGSDVIRVIGVNNPVSGSTVPKGGQTPVTWAGGDGSASVYYSLDDGDSWELAATGLPNSGNYTWSVPNVDATAARVAVVVDDGTQYGASGISGRFAISSIVGVGDGEIAFGLKGAVPNPSSGTLNVAFSLPNAKKATLSLFDVSGRVLASREVGEMGAGRHSVALAQRLPAGMYLVRLVQDGRELKSRAMVVR